MHPVVALLAGVAVGGPLVGAVWWWAGRRRVPEPGAGGQPEAAFARRLLDLMDPAVVVVDVDDAVLLANAVAYSGEGSRITVGAGARSGFAEVAVADRGIGISRADRARVFERFYRVDQSRASSTGGTGLGLAIVKHVATNHGGSVTVVSEEGLGSTFTLRIPLDADGGGDGDGGGGGGGAAVPDLVTERS